MSEQFEVTGNERKADGTGRRKQMVQLIDKGTYLINGTQLLSEEEYVAVTTAQGGTPLSHEEAARGTMTNVNIIQTARACGMERFPIPVVLTNCQNTLCAVGGTINRDDHLFALSAAQKYGGINVPINISVIHTYMREMLAGCGKMIMGADSHTRYGALGTMSVGEGGGELVKQMMEKTYDMPRPNAHVR